MLRASAQILKMCAGPGLVCQSALDSGSSDHRPRTCSILRVSGLRSHEVSALIARVRFLRWSGAQASPGVPLWGSYVEFDEALCRDIPRLSRTRCQPACKSDPGSACNVDPSTVGLGGLIHALSMARVPH